MTNRGGAVSVYPLGMMRGSKNAFYAYMPTWLAEKLDNLDGLSSYKETGKQFRLAGLPAKYLRKWNYNMLVRAGVDMMIAEFIQGRAFRFVGGTNYLGAMERACEAYERALPVIEKTLVYETRDFLDQHLIFYRLDSRHMAIFVDFLGKYYQSLDKNARENLLDEIKPQLVNSFKIDLNEKVNRLVSMNDELFLQTDWQFFPFFKEAIEAYINGLYVSAIALSGVSCERLSLELPRLADKDTQFLEFLEELNQSQRVKLLFVLKIISEIVRDKLVEINIIRNKYLHRIPSEDSHTDAKRCLVLLRELVKQKFDLRRFYDMVDGQLIPKNGREGE